MAFTIYGCESIYRYLGLVWPFLHFFCPHAGGWIATGYPVWSQMLSIISRNWACCKRCSAYYGTLARFFRGQSEIHKIVHHAKFPLYYIEFIRTHTHSCTRIYTAILDTTNWQLFLMVSSKTLLRFYICKFFLVLRRGGGGGGGGRYWVMGQSGSHVYAAVTQLPTTRHSQHGAWT